MVRLRVVSCAFAAFLVLAPTFADPVDVEAIEREAIAVGPGIDPPTLRMESQRPQPEKVSGTVTVKALVDASGEVRRVTIVEASDASLEDLARDVMFSRHYDPAKKDGKPVAVWWTIRLQFLPAEPQIEATLKCDPDSIDDAVPSEPNGATELPTRVRSVAPLMSSKIRRLGNGYANLQCIIDRCGRVKDCKAVQSSGPDYTEAAEHAVLQWLYRPATQDGKPIAVYFTIRVDFKVR
ncbi:MAG TPA: energy transducer TonB [Candidatus Polarisedimenticolaceae bacterium]|nr:energy transducer TonB [Candidatus Polarisedimenticolaceae bacterium]